ncbi:MAG: hypothetical protein PHV28_16740, partial [Kiritimatiellae bacterium]|nr:hypothetical protein [Kiritimatiellia bacterium]
NHAFTALVEIKIGDEAWAPAAGVDVTFALMGAGSACASQLNPVTTDTNGEARYSITSDTAGVSTVNASACVSHCGENLAVATDGTSDNSGPATKTWWDARISIGPDGTNPVGTNHEFTALVEIKVGDEAWAPAAGVDVTFALMGAGSACPSQLNPVTTDTNGEARYRNQRNGHLHHLL